jgi:hypothetical protein
MRMGGQISVGCLFAWKQGGQCCPYRAVALPEGADAEHARAEFQNGVPHVTSPVPEGQSNLRQIPIQTTAASSQAAEQKPAGAEKPGEQKAA